MTMNKRRKPRKQALPQGTFTANISDLLSDGRGLANIDGKATMIMGALPDETVEFEYKNQKKQLLEGQVTSVLSASPYRVEPRCSLFKRCGGCVLQHLAPEQQIAFKSEQLLGNFQKQANIRPKTLAPPLTAEYWGYRTRARVGIKQVRGQQRVTVGFRERYGAYLVDMSHCDVLAPELSALLTPIGDLVTALSCPDSVTQVEMALGGSSPALSFRHVNPFTDADLVILERFASEYHVDIYLQPSGDDSVHGLNHQKTIHYTIDIQTDKDMANSVKSTPLSMAFLPYHFTQVNADINQKMLKQAIDWLDVDKDDDILDLFCGLGNFTLPLAQRAGHVVGIEGSQALVDWAKRNAENNGIDNVDFYRADLTQDTQMMKWRKRAYNKVLIDPPRAGALEIMPLIHQLAPEKVVYISCHPATLARDVDKLVNQYGYQLTTAGVMDMFPHTAHVESMALLTKKAKS